MRFVETLNQKKLTLISMILFLYVLFNLLDGERGLISFFEKQKTIENLIKEKNIITKKLILVEKKNTLLGDKIDLDFLEILYREKFMVGKPKEQIYIGN
mgnify:FL=1|jgi:hypothetical protein|tara:strand:- start:198 stop:494 length:297 start_codon:yes stop_codon:yes gene_type:complete